VLVHGWSVSWEMGGATSEAGDLAAKVEHLR
jgi:hypothetical protein